MAAKPSTLPPINAARGKVLLFLVPLLAIDFTAASKNRAGEIFAGLGALYVAALVSAAAAFAMGRALRGRVVYVRIGMGPIVRRSVVGDRLVVRRALPLALSGLILPGPARFGRDWRLISATGISTYAALFAAGAFTLPLYGALTYCWGVAIVLGVGLSTRDPLTGRRVAARIFQRPTPQTDPVLSDPRRTFAERAAIDAQFGDFIAAERALEQLRATSSGPDEAAALLESEILAARGDFAAAVRVEIPIAADASPNLTAARTARNRGRVAKLMLLAAEQNPSMSAQAVPVALEKLKQLAASPRRAGSDRAGRALYALREGDAAAAAREARICLATARTPLYTADALCTLAVVSSVQGNAKAARGLLNQAARIAPWYPRLTTIQRVLAARAGAVLPAVDAAADTSAVFDDPWAAPGRQ